MSRLATENHDLKRRNRRLQQQIDELNQSLAKCRGELYELVLTPQPAVDVGVTYSPTTAPVMVLTDERE